MTFAALIVAAGSGSRAGQGLAKQWRELGGKPVLRWSAEVLLAGGADPLVVVVRPEDRDMAAQVLDGLSGWRLVNGGDQRSDSVRAGLAEVGDADLVLIHDAARPFVRQSHLDLLIAALNDADGAIPALAVADTLKRQGQDLKTVARDGLLRAQTPQAFRAPALLAAYAALPPEVQVTDDAEVLERAGGRVVVVAGDPLLFKLTYPEDFAMAERLTAAPRTTRTGQGFDAHRLGDGETLWLCGVKIAHDQVLIGHSDADVGLHALTDAILGALGQGDIGDHFPPSDPKWRGAASGQFLRHAAGLVTAVGGRVTNVDVTLVCEQPKIKPHRLAMREAIASLLGIDLDRVSVKATTTEGMGFTGRGEGIAAQAIATLDMPA